MRDTFARTMTELASERKDVCLLSGDIGNRMFDKFKGVAPERFFNCGIAEANMMSVASGLAISGLRPVVYTITPFTTTRCLEQIRIGVSYHDAPVIIVGTGSGLSYAELGATHHSLEDMALLRAMPGMNVLAPADSIELEGQLREAMREGMPTYIRIGKKGEPNLSTDHYSNTKIGKARSLRDGSDVILLSVGPITAEALKASSILEGAGISVGVASLGGCKPLDEDFLLACANKYKRWVSLEEHNVSGGLGSALLEWLNTNNQRSVELKRIGSVDKFIHRLGNQEFTRRMLGIDASGVAKEISTMMSQNR